MSLDAAQRWMHQALVLPHRAGPGEVGAWLVASPRLSGAEGLAAYQRGYFLRLAACMREQFPALCHALEEPLFNDFVADYIAGHPPQSHTLYDLGRRFPGFLEDGRPDRYADQRESWIDFMIDLARFERSVFVMFDAPGHEGRPFATPATPDSALRLQAAFALGAYRYPVAAYYHQVRQKAPAPLPPAAASFVALARTDYVTRTIPLTQPQHHFLEAMTAGADVEAAIAAVAGHLGADPETVRQTWNASARERWLDWGFFIDESA